MPGDDYSNLEQVRLELETRLDQTRERLDSLAKPPERGTAQGFGKRVGDGTTEAVRRLTDIGVGDSMERVRARTERPEQARRRDLRDLRRLRRAHPARALAGASGERALSGLRQAPAP